MSTLIVMMYCSAPGILCHVIILFNIDKLQPVNYEVYHLLLKIWNINTFGVRNIISVIMTVKSVHWFRKSYRNTITTAQPSLVSFRWFFCLFFLSSLHKITESNPDFEKKKIGIDFTRDKNFKNIFGRPIRSGLVNCREVCCCLVSLHGRWERKRTELTS